ncbi:hypothetical protein DEU56DRAFT_347116 [Suillus clintonianus]|uniref:uncharacterized protein n=1 Tax=Suillus clintonianus TaxID=1904413 RepID=UPI001B881182|nr:uncharacterized protein DEU56DRAFT_347116 [Suillus clintonianus]KAG2138026.1 hypothetical protein DEU56DRAFT_347116 [Suillus clintonianus]
MKNWNRAQKDCAATKKLSKPSPREIIRAQSKSTKTIRVSGRGSGIYFFSKHLLRVISLLSCSRLETETNEKLADVYQRLFQAGVDRNESEREAKLKATLPSLQRIFPGVRGRMVDLCKPTQRKYEQAVSAVLGIALSVARR